MHSTSAHLEICDTFQSPTPAPVTKLPFYVFEGQDGSGKTTQLRAIEQHFKQQGREVVALREPGGTEVGEAIRSILKDPTHTISDLTELMLFLAARYQLCVQRLLPSLHLGHVILLDRFTPSTLAYQGYARQMDITTVRRLAALAEGVTPTRTFWIDTPRSVCQLRLAASQLDRFDQLPDDFFRRAERGYLDCLANYPGFTRIDGNRPVEEVTADIISKL